MLFHVAAAEKALQKQGAQDAPLESAAAFFLVEAAHRAKQAGGGEPFGQGLGAGHRTAQDQIGLLCGVHGAAQFHQHLIRGMAEIQFAPHLQDSCRLSMVRGGKWMRPQPADHSGMVRSVFTTSKANS